MKIILYTAQRIPNPQQAKIIMKTDERDKGDWHASVIPLFKFLTTSFIDKMDIY